MTFNLKTEAEICEHFHVTPEQLDKATRVLDCHTGKVFYQVQSQSEPGKVYEVQYNAEYKRLTCTCLAGEAGFGCWHRRAALAAMYEYRQQENLQARREAEEDAQRRAQAAVDQRMEELYRQREEAAKLEAFHLLA
jgi:hypothetical protein